MTSALSSGYLSNVFERMNAIGLYIQPNGLPQWLLFSVELSLENSRATNACLQHVDRLKLRTFHFDPSAREKKKKFI